MAFDGSLFIEFVFIYKISLLAGLLFFSSCEGFRLELKKNETVMP